MRYFVTAFETKLQENRWIEKMCRGLFGLQCNALLSPLFSAISCLFSRRSNSRLPNAVLEPDSKLSGEMCPNFTFVYLSQLSHPNPALGCDFIAQLVACVYLQPNDIFFAHCSFTFTSSSSLPKAEFIMMLTVDCWWIPTFSLAELAHYTKEDWFITWRSFRF